MLLREIRNIFHKELDGQYPREEVDSFFHLLISHCLGLDRFILELRPELVVSKGKEGDFFDALSQLRRQKPIQYILGEAWFMDFTLKVNEHVLIPRPETEELVRWIIADIHRQSDHQSPVADLNILDVGTGSGCIAISLAKMLPYARVYAMDVSEDILRTARENALMNAVRVEWFRGDVLQLKSLPETYDIIVSNPPYIREQEWDKVHRNVREFEPLGALFVPDASPLLFYEKIADLATGCLRPGGALYFEINQALGMESKSVLEDRNFSEIELRKDMFGNERMVRGIWPSPT